MEFDLAVIGDNWQFLAYGVWITILLAAVSGFASLAAGLIIALLRLYGPGWLRVPIVLYIDSMRAIPVLVVLVWTFFALPIVAGVTMSPFTAALIGLTIHLAAYAAEIVRAGIESVRPGQTRAALALGMSRAQVVRRILLPQAIVRMLPAFGSLLSITIKDTAIASVIAVPELMRQSETVAGQSFQPIEIFSFAMLLYFLMLFPVTRGVDRFYRRVAHLGRSWHGQALPAMTLDWSVVWQHRDALIAGTATTFLLTIATMAIAVPCGIVVAVLRLYAWRPVRALATGYVELFRNLPLILVVYWAFYVLPILTGLGLSPLATGLAALSLNVTAYNAETFRAGINSIRRGQVEAAMALGMTRAQALRRVIVPQALRRILPVLASTWVSLFKDTSLVSVIAVTELAYVSMQVRAQTFRVLEMLTAMAVLYWLLGYPQAKLVDWMQRRMKVTE